MKVTRAWLQEYFDAPLPEVARLADALTFHAFEIDEVNGDMLDVKVLPNRAADCLSVRGIARELAAILDMPMKYDPLREPLSKFPKTENLTVMIEDPKRCLRYMGALVRGVKIGPSPEWLRTALESVGQRSINNVVDATNFVMLSIGQPLHVFDAAKLSSKDGAYAIEVRSAREGEKITTLTGDEYTLSSKALVIADMNADAALALAGIKGGVLAQVDEKTTDIIVESGNFDGTLVRRTTQALRLFTDGSLRFQNRPSPELAAYGMSLVLSIIQKVAEGTLEGVVDVYPEKPETKRVSATLAHINDLLGSDFSKEEVIHVFARLGLPTEVAGEIFTVAPPFERTDLTIPEDLAEEVGCILGYDRIPATELPVPSIAPDQARFRGGERMKDQLVEQGFTEVSTQSFVRKGDFILANPLDKDKPALRTSLEENLKDALMKARLYAPLVLSPGAKPKLFEVGTVFPKKGEYVELRMTEVAWEGVPTYDNLSVAKLEEYGENYVPKRYGLGPYKPFSQYPFVIRDIAFWVSMGVEIAAIENILRENAGALLIRLDQFDRFEKEGRTSYAFRLVFQSKERTLTDEEVNSIMEKVANALKSAGYEVR